MAIKKLTSEQRLFTIKLSEGLLDVNLWIKKAEELLVAAEILEMQVNSWWSEVHYENGEYIGPNENENVQAAYSMLVAYAIENYCKSLLMHGNREFLKNKIIIKVPHYIKHHDLIKLARSIDLDLTTHEEELLSRLTRNSVWAARYPIPVDLDRFRLTQTLSDGNAYLLAYSVPDDVKLINQFLDRLRKYVSMEIDNAS